MFATIGNDRLEAKIADHGAELQRLYDKQNGRELLFNADPNWWPSYAPVLFPIIGRLKDGKYTVDGKEFELTPHGLARHQEFTVTSKTENSVWHELRATDATHSIYPFSFVFGAGHELINNTLRFTWSVKNEGDVSMPFSVGAHPAFLCPIEKGETLTDCALDFHREGPLTYRIISTATGLVQPEEYPLALTNGRVALTNSFFDRDVYIFQNSQTEAISLVGKNGKPYLTVESKGFPFVGVWAKPNGAPFVCIEPWFGMADEYNTTGDLRKKTGIMELAPGAEFKAFYDVIVA